MNAMVTWQCSPNCQADQKKSSLCSGSGEQEDDEVSRGNVVSGDRRQKMQEGLEV